MGGKTDVVYRHEARWLVGILVLQWHQRDAGEGSDCRGFLPGLIHSSIGYAIKLVTTFHVSNC